MFPEYDMSPPKYFVKCVQELDVKITGSIVGFNTMTVKESEMSLDGCYGDFDCIF